MNIAGREVLPTNVIPRHYDLMLEPDFEKFTYEGVVTIDLDVAEDTTSISLNTKELQIHSTVVQSNGATHSSNPDVSYDKSSQTTTVKFDKPLSKGQRAQLRHTFTGTLNDDMAGFYRSSYKGPNGETKYIATTQMEATDARRAFPCFDEPALKAEFTVTLVADKDLTCLSNMDIAHEKEVDSKMSGTKKKSVTFNKTPKMSTYLVAFIVGTLKSISTDKYKIPVSVWSTPDQDIEHGKFALDVAAKTLPFYEKAFDAEYPLPKMDMVAIPDFAAGAMENWGLVTYRVVDVLIDQSSTAAQKQRVAETVQHELAHQWFGNLVTMAWWDGLWLNEGFATWMSWYSCNVFFPDWKVWETYIISDFQSALSLDSLRSSHPIEVPVKRADEIDQIFDSISYAKGSSVLRMISKYIGEDTFLEGVRKYVKKHAYGNTETYDLWNALDAASGKPVSGLMDTWTKKVGYPVLSVKEDESKKAITVTQNRFLRTGDVKPEEDKTLYPVNLGLRTTAGVQRDLLLTDRSAEYPLPSLDFYKINTDHDGIYRTSYSPDRLSKLGEAAKAGRLSVEDRAGMIADAGALAASGYQKTSGVLSLIKSFDTETKFIVWAELLARISSLRAAWMFESQSTKDALKKFVRELTSTKAHELGWTFSDSDGNILEQFKSMMFSAAGHAGDPKVVAAARDMFDAFAKGDSKAIHPNLKSAVFSIILANGGGEKEFNAIWNSYLTSTTAGQKDLALRAIASSEDPALIKKVLELAMGKDVKTQDLYKPIGGLRGSSQGIEIRWNWMKDNWYTIHNKLRTAGSLLGSVVQTCTASLCTEQQASDVETFFKTKDTKVTFTCLFGSPREICLLTCHFLQSFDMSIAQSLDAIRAKAAWVKRDGKDVETWLKANGYLEEGERGRL